MNNPFLIEGKTIMVTGASSGIGRATAILCSELGATIIVTGRDEDRLSQTFSMLDKSNKQKHVQFVADLTKEGDIEALVDSVDKLNGLALCAGRGLHLPVQFATKVHMDEMFNINFFAPTELLRLLYKRNKIEREASVVVMSSLGGKQIFRGRNSIYGASKAALSSFMKFCALEFSTRKIRVNCVCPGMVDTPFIHRDTVTNEQLEEDAQRYPLKRYGKPEDVANMIVFLLSDASSWVTGQEYIIDGGISIS